MKIQQCLTLIMFLNFFNISSQESQYKKNLESLKFIEGNFATKISFPNGDGNWKTPVDSKFTFQKIMKDMYIEGKGLIPFDSTFSASYRMTFDYDTINDVYRLVALDDAYGFMDIYYGNWEANQLILSNETTGTQVINEGNRVYGRLIITSLKKGTFKIVAKVSQDNKVTWQNYMKMEFTPQ